MPGQARHGPGLGLRRELVPDLMAGIPDRIGFLELAPGNRLDMGGARRRELRHFAGSSATSMDTASACTPSTCPGAPTTAIYTSCCRSRSPRRHASAGPRTSWSGASPSKTPPATSPRPLPRWTRSPSPAPCRRKPTVRPAPGRQQRRLRQGLRAPATRSRTRLSGQLASADQPSIYCVMHCRSRQLRAPRSED